MNELPYDYIVKLEFPMPQASEEMEMAINAGKYAVALHDIYNHCRRVWKYQENPSEELVKFAEEIAQMTNIEGFS